MHFDQRSVMTTAEEVMMKRSHFRLKVDLSKFFHDARRFCWVFVDGTKIQQIIHMKQHISELFNIAEPFHLLLNDTEYLPPTEDVRILKENEMILVVPGSGIINGVTDMIETSNSSMQDKQVEITNNKTGIVANLKNISNDTLNNTPPISIGNITRDMTFYSVINDTVIDRSEGDTDSKATDNLTEDYNVIDSIASVTKRKRVRKRRPKNRSQLSLSPPDMNEVDTSKEIKSKKPKIIDSYVISSGKHIRFDNTENEETNIAKQIVQEASRNESYLSKTSSSRDLSTLLALGQSSTPITFVNKKLKNEVKTESLLNDEIRSKNLNKIMEDNVERNLCSKEAKKKIQSCKSLYAELEKVPVMTRKPHLNDVIAFKTLKIGTDYTPQMSNFILTEVIGLCAQSANYTLRILDGREEIQVPFGKFSLSEDTFESHPDGDTFVLNYSQMKELRLVS